MPNRTGTAYALTTFARLEDSADADELERYLQELPRGADSPFHRLTGVHLTRVQLFRTLVHQGPKQTHDDRLRHPHLVFTSVFDGDRDAYLDQLRVKVPECDRWWGDCVGYPGRSDAAAFAAWVRSLQRTTTLFQSPFPTATVGRIRESVAMRERVLDFAVSTQGLDDDALLRRFREDF
ncbi:hypothetical protein [Microbacterium thalassium]|uniref:Uncharacterized protein n=1 Tax=Microbacterium thalassium TaxID=362649 RepID=A0A7X0FQN2_9MICO|nr:hypothetical protein [Microbacterium thalassium]MBB6391917.1 hypothetical protein [Microbacterium thalassium]GLK23937.1 hypothetical protein GCM10017607_12550 [Microbacterium thalassium]